MKAMQGGMGMMKEMHGMSGNGSMAGMGAMPASKDVRTDMANHHRMMKQRMDAMQMMMDMMADRVPPAPPGG